MRKHLTTIGGFAMNLLGFGLQMLGVTAPIIGQVLIFLGMALLLISIVIYTRDWLNSRREKAFNPKIISLVPKSRENGNYVSIKVTNHDRKNPVWCRASIYKMDWFKQNPYAVRGGKWETIDISERGPLSWHHGGTDHEGYRKVHIDPAFINIAKIPEDMNLLIRGNILFTFLVEHPYKAGLYRLWIDVICKQDERYLTKSWLGCIDVDVSKDPINLVIEECEDVEKWKREKESQTEEER